MILKYSNIYCNIHSNHYLQIKDELETHSRRPKDRRKILVQQLHSWYPLGNAISQFTFNSNSLGYWMTPWMRLKGALEDVRKLAMEFNLTTRSLGCREKMRTNSAAQTDLTMKEKATHPNMQLAQHPTLNCLLLPCQRGRGRRRQSALSTSSIERGISIDARNNISHFFFFDYSDYKLLFSATQKTTNPEKLCSGFGISFCPASEWNHDLRRQTREKKGNQKIEIIWDTGLWFNVPNILEPSVSFCLLKIISLVKLVRFH